ncbi:MAG: stage III sporulation protein AE [Oscillospiraceae bacterium]
MRRILLTLAKLLAVIAAAFLLCGSARAEGSGEYGDINSALSDAVPPEASEILEGGGITPDNNGAAALSFGGVLEFLRDMLMDRLTEPLRLFASLCGVVILCALSRSSADGAGGTCPGCFRRWVLAGAGMTTAAISGALRDTLDVLSAASEFMLVFVPVFAGVIAAMGKAAAASAANTVILAAAQFFSQISVNFLTPVCGTVMGLSVTGAVHPEMSTDKLGELIRKAAVWGLSLLMTVFMSVLSAQTFVTNSADNVLIRTAKFAVSSGVPIVGGTISDAVNTVHASLSLMHSSIGTYGIAAGIVILLPSLISVVCYRFALTAAEAVSEVFGVKELSTLFRACGAVMSIIMAVIVCFLLLNTISAVIMLAAGSSQA